MTGSMDHPGLTIMDAVQRAVEAHPDKTAFTFRGAGDIETRTCSMSYAELWGKASAIGDGLDLSGMGGLALLVMPLGPELLAHHLAILMSGASASIYAHPSPKIAPEVYSRNLLHAAERIQPGYVMLSDQTGGDVRENLEAVGVKCKTALPLDQLGAASGVPSPRRGISPGAPAIVQHSSGSTGLAKGIRLSHEKVVNHCLAYGRFFDFSAEGDVICSWLPLYHDMGLFTSWLMPLIHGATVHFLDPFDWIQRPLSILRLAAMESGTLIWQPNFAFGLLASRVSDHELETLDLGKIRGFVNCSEPVTPLHMKAFLRKFGQCGVAPTQLWNCYGMAENGFAVTQTTGEEGMARTVEAGMESFAHGKAIPVKEGPSRSIASCGKPIEGCQVKIVDDGLRPLEDGAVGEIAIKSPYLFDEYINNPTATGAAFDGEGWYLTGDLGFSLNGHLYVTGRKKDLLISGGRNFYPHDIEQICHGAPGVIPGRAVALGLDDDVLGTQRIVVIVESKSEDKKTLGAISETVRKLVYDELDCAVSEVLVVPHMWLLKTSSGKIARQPNLEKYRDHKSKLVPIHRAPAPGKLESVSPSSPLAVAAWAFAVALVFYLFMLLVALSVNKSWIVYINF